MKEKLKVYHGLPKTPTTENTLFYASLDGSVHPEIHYGPVIKRGVERSFSAGVTGYCLNELNDQSELSYKFPEYTTNNLPEVSTVDLWAYYPGYQGKIMRFAYVMFCDIIILQDEYLNVGFWNNRIRVKKLEKGYYHFRLIIKPLNRTTGETSIDLYINGKKEGTYITTISDSANPLAGVTLGHMSDSYACAVSDVHVTLEDLGDYFPTLPQDFIDGKAIVVPALNQRQSYGDPVLHQVTNLLVPAQLESERGKYYSETDRDSDGYERCLASPELHVGNWHNWAETYGKIRITGLNNTVITGVIDTDTSVARVVKSGYAPNTKLYLDSVVGLSVGDTVRIAEVAETSIYFDTVEVTIQSIDVNEKSIGITSTDWIIVAGRHYIFETTPSSSTPVVKTVDGAIVNGTWSGLGTRVATFTFGDNSNIVGKDLVVTYCLNAIGNSSPYPKMPSEVIRGYNELGHELIPANEIVIQDDFKGKVSGSTETCPHTLKWSFTNSFNGLSGTEFAQAKYNSLNDPTDYVQSGTDISGEYPKHIVSIDLIKVVENKFGCEIPGNKVNWLKNNISVTTCYFDCYGWLQGSNYYVEARYYMPDNKNWGTNSGTSHRHSGSDFKYIHVNGGAELIDSEGKIHFLVTTNASNGSASYLRVKDIYFKVTFTKSDIYDYLYPKNTHARFGEKGNPILVDKQTKEVKRLLPSTAPFSTEVLLHSPTKQDKRFEDLGLLYDPSHTYITTHGTGTSCPTYDVFRGLVAKLDMSALFPHKLLSENLFNSPVTNADYRSSKIKRVLSQPYPSNFNFDSVEDAYEVDSVYLSPRLVQYGKEVYLYVLAYQLDCTNYRDNSATTQVIYKLPNRPLIK